MKILLKASVTTAIALFLICNAPVASFAQCPCVLNCPLCLFVPVPSAGGGYKTPDLDGNGTVALADFAMFALCYPPNAYCFCADYDCNSVINLADFSMFAMHWTHTGPLRGFNQPPVDHYKTYEVDGPFITGPVYLRDQFGEEVITSLQLTKFATPVWKLWEHHNLNICDSLTHQTWWEFQYPEPQRFVEVQDQFGVHDWLVGDARYLLVPALKNPVTGDTIPRVNHYKCYEAEGPTMGFEVTLVDQFDSTWVVVLQGEYFCNPCEKETMDGIIYPIVDPVSHLACYRIQNPVPYNLQVFVKDQFIEEFLVLHDNLYLCLPALKEEVIQP